MDTWQLRDKVFDELALTWLEEPGHTFSPPGFARALDVPGHEVRQALDQLGKQGLVLLRHEDEWAQLGAVLTVGGQREWVRGPAEACLPGVQSQLRQTYRALQGSTPLTSAQLERALELPTPQVRQLVQILRSLGAVMAALDLDGTFTGIELAGPLQLE